MQHNINISKELIQLLLENRAFNDLETLECPECSCIEDEQYTCTTCWGTDLNIQSVISSLFKQKFEGLNTDVDYLSILNENFSDITLTVFYGEHCFYSDINYDSFFDDKIEGFDKENYQEEYAILFISDIIHFLTEK